MMEQCTNKGQFADDKPIHLLLGATSVAGTARF
jgi:hypothetical protein